MMTIVLQRKKRLTITTRRPNKKNHKEPEPQQEVEYEDIHSPYEPNNPMDNISFC